LAGAFLGIGRVEIETITLQQKRSILQWDFAVGLGALPAT
jgi:hypothetical protein